MATAVIMPRQGQTVESCIISNWHKKVGDKVNVGDILFTYETDKATFDEEAKVEGTLLAIFFQEGDDVPVLTNVCVIGNEGEDYNEFIPEGADTQKAEEIKPAEEKVEVKVEKVAKKATGQSNATPVIMPRQGNTVESCIISQWHKKVGDKVNVGDILFTYETDKATFDEEAKVEGTLLAIFFEEGDDVPVLTNVAVIGAEGDDYSDFIPGGVAEVEEEVAAPAPAAAPQAPVKQVAAEEKASVTDTGRIMISPRARNLAEKAGVNPMFVSGKGPYGRIIESDIKDFIAQGSATTYAAMDKATKDMAGTGIGGRVTTSDLTAQPAPQVQKAATASAPVQEKAPFVEYEDVKLPNIRKVIAKAMHHSLSSMAQLTLNASFDATNIMEFRKQVKANKDKLGLENITINDIILYAVSRTVLNHRDCNAHFLDDKMRYFNTVNLGVAVDTPRGLMVPTLFNAERKSLNEISKEAKSIAQMAQSGNINPDLLQGGTITITNLGTLGIESFTPVINPPQTCILGVNTLETRVKNVNGEMKMYQSMTLSLTFDHRALDGAPAARFLQELCRNLENFTILLAK